MRCTALHRITSHHIASYHISSRSIHPSSLAPLLLSSTQLACTNPQGQPSQSNPIQPKHADIQSAPHPMLSRFEILKTTVFVGRQVRRNVRRATKSRQDMVKIESGTIGECADWCLRGEGYVLGVFGPEGIVDEILIVSTILYSTW